MLPCPFHLVTGLDCPFCGGQRMVVELLHGHFGEAFWLNPGLAIGLPLAALWWFRHRELTSNAALVMLAIAIAWGVLRNLISITPPA